MARRSVGVSGTALFLGVVGIYLVYVGVEDVPFVDGMRELFQQKKPTPRKEHSPYEPDLSGSTPTGGAGGGTGELGPVGPNDSGIDKLRGNARIGYRKIRGMNKRWTIYGWGLRPSGNSDHPLGKAIDVMNPTGAEALMIIAAFKTMPGAKYWIWNREIGQAKFDWVPRRYTGPSPHTDHVHLSWL
jgi:hypothetical protein